MATYAIGDIQGCYSALRRLLDTLAFEPHRDTLWIAGDLVNRGPENAKTLHFIHQLGQSAKVVLGNHDLHLLAYADGVRAHNRKDTLEDVINDKHREELLHWLRRQPLMHWDQKLNCVMTHAGVAPQWTLHQAAALAEEVSKVLQGNPSSRKAYLKAMYSNENCLWENKLTGQERLRSITNYFTRMRFCTAEGELEFKSKTGPESPPKGFQPWYQVERVEALQQTTLLFGHWAALAGETGSQHHIGLDTGCVWGGHLTAYCLETEQRFCESCPPIG